jgi:hypothetical protein
MAVSETRACRSTAGDNYSRTSIKQVSMAKNPADMFFWNDWDNDPELRLCSLAAQGFWMRCLCIAARQLPKGYVASEGRPLTSTDLARVAGCSEQEAESLMAELLSKGVATRDRAGRIYNRRMVSRAKVSAERSKAGKEGAAVTNGNNRRARVLPRQELGKEVGKHTGKNSATSILPDIHLGGAVADAPAKTRGHRLPEDWQPSPEDRSFAVSLGLDPDWVAPKFRDYWHSKPGQAGVKLDWSKTFRNWCRSEAERGGRKPQAATPPAGGTSPHDSKMASRLKYWRETGKWSQEWGPEPGKPGCQIPQWMLEKAA